MAYPTTLDDFTPHVDGVDDVMAADVNELQTAIEAIQAKLGIDSSADTDSVDYKLTQKAPLTAPTFGTSITGSYLTASEMLITDADKKIVSAPVATYPSLTELSYIKGLSSAIQTQLNAKAPSANPTFTGTVILPKTLEIQDTSADHQYVLGVNELTADRTVTLPLLTGNDEFTFNAHTQTLTNKRNVSRVTTITSHATPTVNTDNCDCVTITAQAEAISSMTTNLSGTPNNFDRLLYRIKDNGTARAITWGASFQAGSEALPTTTVLGKTLMVGFFYDSVDSKWTCEATKSRA